MNLSVLRFSSVHWPLHIPISSHISGIFLIIEWYLSVSLAGLFVSSQVSCQTVALWWVWRIIGSSMCFNLFFVDTFAASALLSREDCAKGYFKSFSPVGFQISGARNGQNSRMPWRCESTQACRKWKKPKSKSYPMNFCLQSKANEHLVTT